MKEIKIDMSISPDVVLHGVECTYPSALKQLQEQGVAPEDAPKVLYAIGFCKASETMHQSICEGVEQLLTDIKECIENDEDFTVEYTNKRHIFTEEALEEYNNVPKNLN